MENKWEFEDKKIKVGKQYKDRNQLKKEIVLELFIALGLGILAVIMLPVNTLMMVVALLACFAAIITLLGTRSHLEALNHHLRMLRKQNKTIKKD